MEEVKESIRTCDSADDSLPDFLVQRDSDVSKRMRTYSDRFESSGSARESQNASEYHLFLNVSPMGEVSAVRKGYEDDSEDFDRSLKEDLRAFLNTGEGMEELLKMFRRNIDSEIQWEDSDETPEEFQEYLSLLNEYEKG